MRSIDFHNSLKLIILRRRREKIEIFKGKSMKNMIPNFSVVGGVVGQSLIPNSVVSWFLNS